MRFVVTYADIDAARAGLAQPSNFTAVQYMTDDKRRRYWGATLGMARILGGRPRWNAEQERMSEGNVELPDGRVVKVKHVMDTTPPHHFTLSKRGDAQARWGVGVLVTQLEEDDEAGWIRYEVTHRIGWEEYEQKKSEYCNCREPMWRVLRCEMHAYDGGPLDG